MGAVDRKTVLPAPPGPESAILAFSGALAPVGVSSLSNSSGSDVGETSPTRPRMFDPEGTTTVPPTITASVTSARNMSPFRLVSELSVPMRLSLIVVPRGTVASIQRAAGTGLVSGMNPPGPGAGACCDAV